MAATVAVTMAADRRVVAGSASRRMGGWADRRQPDRGESAGAVAGHSSSLA